MITTKNKLQLISNKICNGIKPISLNILLTYNCNFSCKHCYISPEREKDNIINNIQIPITLEKWKFILKEFYEAGTIYLRISGGEPTIYPYFIDLYNFAWDLGYKIEIATNGYLLYKYYDLLKSKKPFLITFSLYGISDETYSKFCHIERNGFTNLHNSILFCKNHDVSYRITYVLTKYNALEMDKIYKFGINENWDLNCLRTMQNDTKGNANPSQYNATVDEIVRSYRIFGDVRKKLNHFRNLVWNNGYKTCFSGSTSFNVNPYGEMYLCSSCFNIKYKIDRSLNEMLSTINNSRRINIEKKNQCSDCNLKHWCGLCTPIANEKIKSGIFQEYCSQQKYIFNNLRRDFIMQYKLKYNYDFSEVEGDFIVTPKNGEITSKAMVVNSTTYHILNALQEKCTISDLVQILKKYYQVDEDSLYSDVDAIITELKHADLIEEYDF